MNINTIYNDIVYLIIITVVIYYIRYFIIKYLILSVSKTFIYVILLRLTHK